MATAAQFSFFDASGPIALAHRGGTLYPPNEGIENSLRAFRQAVALGYRHLETDVHATADGQVVAFHDPRLDRVTDATGVVAELPYAVVAQARIGGTEPIPTLVELLEELPHASFNIDIKADPALEPTLDILRRMGALERVCLASFSDKRIRRVRRLLGGQVATSAGEREIFAMKLTPGFIARWLHTDAPALQVPSRHRIRGRELAIVTPGLVDLAHRLGKHVHVWFHDWDKEDAAELHRLFDLGVDGIVSDRIDLLADVLAERGHPLRPRP
ncbi:MAG: glycerophosphodiester phosphodiesterase family protein [Dermatophilaceae bacterium]|nr:glycerophosphodiester phosphodiesterase [Intrasporangiaceae bacterium]